MAGQATINGRTLAGDPALQRPEGFAEGVGAFGNNLAQLAALQARLAAYDLRECLGYAMPGLIAGGLALLLVPAAVVVGLFGLALWLTSVLDGWTQAQVMFLVCGVGLAFGVLLVILAIWRLRASLTAFRSSQEELQRNVAWVRTVLAYSGR